MKKPIPIPDPVTVREKMQKVIKPLLDLGIPEKPLIDLLTSEKFWRANKVNKEIMINELYKKSKKESDANSAKSDS